MLLRAMMLALAVIVTSAASLWAAEGDTLAYESHILPIVRTHCAKCHNETTRKAELDLTSRAGLLKGGESGPIVVPGKSSESLLYEMLHDKVMPPENSPPLDADHVNVFKRWIDAGAKFTDAPESTTEPAVQLSQHDIVPIMLHRCTVCHGLRKQEGGLDLRTKASMLKGGKSGPAIVLGKPDESLVIQKTRAGVMPPNKRLQEVSVKPITGDEIDKVAQWIAAGAPEVDLTPDVATTAPDPQVTDAERQFWSFQPPKAVKPPQVRDSSRVRNAIDAFIVDKLDAAGLTLAPEADAATLCRRLYFDLTGLPPTPEEVEEFLRSFKEESGRGGEGEKAYLLLVDKLLNSPRYGERWGRYWLDLAGYADSEGKRSQDPLRPFAYKYRDYVIRSLNADKPYDRFLLEQLAGDELADYENAPEMTRELVDNLVATAFLKMAPDGTGSNVVNFVPERLEVIADEMEVFGSVVLGLTLKCARCHTHKYDPIPHRDYYRVMACFKGALDEHDWLKPSAVPGQSEGTAVGSRLLMYGTADEHDEIADHNARIQREIDAANKLLQRQADAKSMTIDQLKKVDEKFAAEVTSHNTRLKALESQKVKQPAIQALWDRGEPSPTYIYRRGDYLSPGKLVGPGVLSALTDGRTPFEIKPPFPGSKSSGRRLALAKWLTNPEHPLTARVMVNRLWKHHFGVGIVKTLDNFGKLGTPPSHPELLDWMSRAFVEQGWSMKAMHRMMVTSSTYRQSSTVTPVQLKIDPENRLVSRMPLVRLDAESLRDTLLLIAGKLDERRYGAADGVTPRADGLMSPQSGVDGSFRRTVYVRQRRKEIPTILETFDLPQMNPNCIERTESTVAAQALHLLNNTQVRELAEAMAERVVRESPADDAHQVERAMYIALGRPPRKDETAASLAMYRQLVAAWTVELQKANEAADSRNDPQSPQFKALITFCHTLMNSAALLYVD